MLYLKAGLKQVRGMSKRPSATVSSTYVLQTLARSLKASSAGFEFHEQPGTLRVLACWSVGCFLIAAVQISNFGCSNTVEVSVEISESATHSSRSILSIFLAVAGRRLPPALSL